MDATCNSCKTKFKIEPEMQSTERGGERYWFTCPGCGREYQTALITPEGVSVRNDIKKLRTKMRQARETKGRVPNYLNSQLKKLLVQMENEVSGGQGPVA